MSLISPDKIFIYGIQKYGGLRNFGVNEGNGGVVPAVPTFRFSVKTENAGTSNDNQFTVPLIDSNPVDFTINWGDDTSDNINTWNDAALTHTYTAGAGTYDITVTGTFNGWQFNYGGDKRKPTLISEWGCFDMSVSDAFDGCFNLVITASDAPAITGTSVKSAFRNCPKITQVGDIANFIFPVGCTATGWFEACRFFNQDLTPLQTANLTSLYKFLHACTRFEQNIGGMVIATIASFSEFLTVVVLTPTNYDALLTGFQGQPHQNNVTANFGASKFSRGDRYVASTADGTTASKLIDSAVDFSAGGLNVQVGDVIWNTTDGTWARVTAIDDATTLSLDTDIMVSGESYKLLSSAAAIAKAALIIDDNWAITDDGDATP